MADVMQIKGMDRLLNKLQHVAKTRLESPSQVKGHGVIVGYTASYALAVHENIEMKWRGVPRDPRKRAVGGEGPAKYHQKNPQSRKYKPKGKFWDPPNRGQSKFLEQPARELSNDGTLKRIIADAIRNGAKLQHALSLAALRIQRESMKLVPVDTGNLKSTAFTRKE